MTNQESETEVLISWWCDWIGEVFNSNVTVMTIHAPPRLRKACPQHCTFRTWCWWCSILYWWFALHNPSFTRSLVLRLHVQLAVVNFSLAVFVLAPVRGMVRWTAFFRLRGARSATEKKTPQPGIRILFCIGIQHRGVACQGKSPLDNVFHL